MKKNTEEKAKTEPPTLAPTPPPSAGTPPDRPHPVPVKQKRESSRLLATADPCASLTAAAIQAVIDEIIESRDKAVSDAAAHGAEGGPGYPGAARYNLAYLTQARDEMLALRNWLQTAEVLDQPPFVTNVSASYNIHGYVRETVVALHNARHWATISAVYHISADARDSYELTTQALDLIEPLGAQAGRCYMGAYLP
jgi:hypothetical protein